VVDPLDCLAEVSAHIPDVHEQTTIFDGWYSHRTRGYRKRQGLRGEARAAVVEATERAPRAVRRSWARLIRQWTRSPARGSLARLRGSPRSPIILALPTTDSAEDLAAVALDTPIHRW